MEDKTEMVLVTRDELQQLIGASVRCALEEYGQAQAPQEASEYYTIRQLAAREAGAYQGAADWAARPIPERAD